MMGFLLGARAFLKSVPWQVWVAIAVVIASFFAVRWHSGQIKAYGTERFQAGRNYRDSEILALQKELDAKNAELAAELRRKHDEAARSIARDADALRLHGPGKAACSGPAFTPARTAGHEQSGGAGDAAVDEVPDGARAALIALPFPGAVAFAEQHDAFRLEALAWREWHRRFYDKWKAAQESASAIAE